VNPSDPRESLATRPGWAELREASDELHAAELLIGDPIAVPKVALPHLREFWAAIVAAGVAAGVKGVGEDDSNNPDATALTRAREWLARELPGVPAQLRRACAEQLETLASAAPNKRALRSHTRAARRLLAALEPELGGVPLRRRKQRRLWSCVGAAIVVVPVLLYAVLSVEVPGTGPWRAAYYADTDFGDDPVVVREDSVDHDWKDTAPHEKLAPDKYSVRWDTCLRIDEAGPVVLQVHANDGARVILAGETVIDAWDKHPITNRRGFGSTELQLEPGIHHLRVEFFENLGNAHIKLSASFDGELPGLIPRDRLVYPGDDFDEQDPCAEVR
jgi:hypothetical protein